MYRSPSSRGLSHRHWEKTDRRHSPFSVKRVTTVEREVGCATPTNVKCTYTRSTPLNSPLYFILVAPDDGGAKESTSISRRKMRWPTPPA